jgi:hypothetical protein
MMMSISIGMTENEAIKGVALPMTDTDRNT